LRFGRQTVWPRCLEHLVPSRNRCGDAPDHSGNLSIGQASFLQSDAHPASLLELLLGSVWPHGHVGSNARPDVKPHDPLPAEKVNKVHARVDAEGRPRQIDITPGNYHDNSCAEVLLEGTEAGAIIGDKA
jgi:IS5 family transposase